MNGKQLKNSILQWAIQGKLVPQDASEEPAIELLKRINPKFVQSEYEGELPQGWSVTTMSMLCSLNDGEKIQDKTMVNLDAKYLRGKSVGTILKSGRYIPANSLIILVDGENSGEVFRTPIEGYQGSTFKRLAIDENMYENFVLWVINSHRVKLREHKVGSAIPHLNKKLFRETLVLVPPFAEQKRIVEKLEELMPLVERYTKAQEGLDKLNEGIKEKLRASILQEAKQGKLVPQDANDEPAIELLKRINPKFTPLECKEELPQGWSVSTLSTLCALIDGEKIQDKEMVNLDAKYLRGKSVGTILKSGRYIPANSLIILVDGENSGEVFRTPIEGYQGSTFKRLAIDENMYENFVLRVINSHRVKLREHKVGSAIPHLNKKLFRETLVLVPPFAEQKRIVEKLEELFGVLGRL